MRHPLALLPIVLLAVAACGGGASPSPSSPAAAPTTAASEAPSVPASEAPSPTEEPTATEEPTGSGQATVMVADSEHGEILVDGEGRTLYLFTPDEAGEPTCYDACAEAWPPLLAEGEITVGEGLDDSAFSTATRTDGGEQVKIGSWPLYYFANDAAPGDTNGQGLNDVWFVVSPEGEAIR
jgi:predicted lipoprotein with Yx(FWY)xxD motif